MSAANLIHKLITAADFPGVPDQHYLLQYLVALQEHYAGLPGRAIEALAEILSIPVSRIDNLISFYSFLHDSPRGQYDVRFSNNITDLMAGSLDLHDQLCRQLQLAPGIARADGVVTVDRTSCTGMGDQGPALLVNGWAITHLDPDRIGAIADLIEQQSPLSNWPQEWFHVHDNIQLSGRLLNDSLAVGAGLQRGLDNGPDWLLEEMDHSGLQGRGGAGFGCGRKWRMCRDAPGNLHYVVCNADEGEPGTFKDRVLLNRYAHDVFEGMTLCAAAIGADKGFLYLRGEYRYLLAHLKTILHQRRKQGLLGRAILGNAGFHFDIEIHLGAGAYICGEESALIESLQGQRGIPRNRPPFPVTAGYLEQPTVVNNVETFFNATKIARYGAQWFRQAGTSQSPGTKLLSISGDCQNPGIYEVPFGTSIQQILEFCAAAGTQAVQVSGAAGMTLASADFQRSIGCEDIPAGGSFMVFNGERNILDMVLNFSRFFAHESCGFCTPCRVGTSLIRDLLEKLHKGNGSQMDLDQMQAIGELMQQASHCGLGATAALPVLNTLQTFSQTYQTQLKSQSYTAAIDTNEILAEARAIRDQKSTPASTQESR